MIVQLTSSRGWTARKNYLMHVEQQVRIHSYVENSENASQAKMCHHCTITFLTLLAPIRVCVLGMWPEPSLLSLAIPCLPLGSSSLHDRPHSLLPSSYTIYLHALHALHAPPPCCTTTSLTFLISILLSAKHRHVPTWYILAVRRMEEEDCACQSRPSSPASQTPSVYSYIDILSRITSNLTIHTLGNSAPVAVDWSNPDCC